MSYLSEVELEQLGLTAGRGVRISRDARIFGADRVLLGDNVRIDAFCIVSSGPSGKVKFGSHIHIASGVRIFGEGGISLGDFSSISAGSTLYSASDDYSGEWLMGPHLPPNVTSVDARPIEVGPFAAVGAHALVLPGVVFGEGAVLGAMSMARGALSEWTIYAGVPCRRVRSRLSRVTSLAEQVRRDYDRP